MKQCRNGDDKLARTTNGECQINAAEFVFNGEIKGDIIYYHEHNHILEKYQEKPGVFYKSCNSKN